MRDEILILNGPNLNALGRREPEKYGLDGLAHLEQEWEKWGQVHGVKVRSEQSNFEGKLLDILHTADSEQKVGAAVFNPGAYTHTSRALRDGIASLSFPVIEVHITNVAAREEWRHHSVVAEVCVGSIIGLGIRGYRLGLQAAMELIREAKQ